jgi:hypothetical protein
MICVRGKSFFLADVLRKQWVRVCSLRLGQHLQYADTVNAAWIWKCPAEIHEGMARKLRGCRLRGTAAVG